MKPRTKSSTAKKSPTLAMMNDTVQRPDGPVDAQTRHQMIAEAAYYLAEQRGFVNGSTEEDWITAEARIDAMLSNVH